MHHHSWKVEKCPLPFLGGSFRKASNINPLGLTWLVGSMQWLVEFALCVGVVFFSLPPIAEKYFSPSKLLEEKDIGFGVAVGLLSDIFWI